MPSDQNEKNKFAATLLDAATHLSLIRAATKLSKHPSDLVEKYIRWGIDRETEEMDDPPPMLRIFNAIQKLKADDIIFSQLKFFAYRIKEGHGDNQSQYEELEVLCEAAGYTIDSVMKDEANRVGAPIMITDSSTGVTAAMAWLRQNLGREDELPAKAVENMAALDGFSSNVLSDAKRNLGIMSKRRSNNWVWLWPDSVRVEEEEEEHDVIYRSPENKRV